MIPKSLLGILEDVRVSFAPVPQALAEARSCGVLWQTAPGRFLLDLPGVARYLVEFGKSVTIDTVPEVETETVERFFRMTPLAALLCQRGVLPLHAACAANGSGSVILAGDSGVGKTTLLTALVARGWKILADDLTALDVGPSGNVTVCPVFPEVALWPDALRIMTGCIESLPRACGNRHVLSLSDHFCSDPQPVTSIFHLCAHSGAGIDVAQLFGSSAFQAIGMISYNSHIADSLFDRSCFMRCAAALSNSTPLYRLRRPRGQWSVDELADLVSRGIT